jgi:hypothetical protein
MKNIKIIRYNKPKGIEQYDKNIFEWLQVQIKQKNHKAASTDSK